MGRFVPAARGHWRTHLRAPVVGMLAMLGVVLALLPGGFDAGWLLYAQDDPELLADRVVARTLTPAVANDEVAAALDAKDLELAESFAELAKERGIALAPPLTARLDAARKDAAALSHQADQFARGFVTGEPDDMVSLAGTALGDLFVFGDVRDAVREGMRYTRGEPTDELVLGLACVGLAVTAGTYASLGAGTPARIGLSLVKAARKTGRLGARLAAWMGRSLHEVVDLSAVRRVTTSFDQPVVAVRAARDVVKLEKLGGLADLSRDVGRVQRSAGTRATVDGLRMAESPRDMRRLAKLAETKGSKTQAILKLGGRAALALTAAVMNLFSWAFAAVLAVWSFLSAIKSTTERTTRRVLNWRRARRRRQQDLQSRSRTEGPIQPVRAPATAHSPTTSHGGVRHMNSKRNAVEPIAKSAGPLIPDVQTG
jgi:hypothetical protein